MARSPVRRARSSLAWSGPVLQGTPGVPWARPGMPTGAHAMRDRVLREERFAARFRVSTDSFCTFCVNKGTWICGHERPPITRQTVWPSLSGTLLWWAVMELLTQTSDLPGRPLSTARCRHLNTARCPGVYSGGSHPLVRLPPRGRAAAWPPRGGSVGRQ